MSKPIAACATPSASCWRICRASTKRSASASPRCRSWSASCWPGWPNWMPWCARPMRITISTASHATLFNFCTNELVGLLFRHPQGRALLRSRVRAQRRRGARTVTDEIFRRIVTWFAPILCFTMEEAWAVALPRSDSVHLNDFFATPADWSNPALIEKWKRIRDLAPRGDRRAGTGARRQEDRLQPGGRARAVRHRRRRQGPVRYDRSGGSRHHFRRHGGSFVAICARPSMPSRCQGRGRQIRQQPMAKNAPAAGACWRK